MGERRLEGTKGNVWADLRKVSPLLISAEVSARHNRILHRAAFQPCPSESKSPACLVTAGG
jgi:hypothetical protein